MALHFSMTLVCDRLRWWGQGLGLGLGSDASGGEAQGEEDRTASAAD